MTSRNQLTICRLCLSENECFINIFELNDWQGYVAADVISNLLHFQVSETDGYPHVVCSECLIKLTDFKLFKECCQKSMVTYDKIFVSNVCLEKHKPEMCIGEGGCGLEISEQDLLKEAISIAIIKEEELDIDRTSGDRSDKPFEGTNTLPIIKEEDLDIDSSCSESDKRFEETNAEVSYGPILLKHEMLSFNRDIHTQEILYESDVFENADMVEPAAISKEDFTQVHLRAADTVTHSHHLQCSDHKRPRCTSKGVVDADLCTMNISTKSKFEKSKNISLHIEVEASSSGTMERIEGQWISPRERLLMAPLVQEDIGIGVDVEKEGGKIKKEMDAEVEPGCAPEKQVKGERKGLECYHCGNMLKTKSTLKQHMTLHGFGLTYNCDACGKVFLNKGGLVRHVSIHTGYKAYKCTECSKPFRQNCDLIVHMRSHTGLKPYKCAECGKCYSQRSSLSKHMKSHTGSKPYKCAECSKCFVQSSNLKVHMRLHTGSKPYECAECSKCFSTNSSLTIHMRTHTGSKPYKCAECRKCFIQNCSLTKHMRSHMSFKPYKCAECSKCFNQNSDLKQHMTLHTGSKPYKCADCSKCFSKNSNLKVHMKRHHIS